MLATRAELALGAPGIPQSASTNAPAARWATRISFAASNAKPTAIFTRENRGRNAMTHDGPYDFTATVDETEEAGTMVPQVFASSVTTTYLVYGGEWETNPTPTTCE